jgi:hypothetical protein
MAFENYEDIREGDVIEIFETESVERQLACHEPVGGLAGSPSV